MIIYKEKALIIVFCLILIIITFNTIFFKQNKVSIKTIYIPINKAFVEELILIPGIGEQRARKIYFDRVQNGTYKNFQSLSKIGGFGKNLVNRIKKFSTLFNYFKSEKCHKSKHKNK